MKNLFAKAGFSVMIRKTPRKKKAMTSGNVCEKPPLKEGG